MATHYVIGDSMSPFMKRVLIPFWVVRILFMVIDIIAYGLAIGVLAAYVGEADDYDGGYGVGADAINAALAIAVVVVLLIVVCLALDIVCIVKRARRTLSPRFFLIVNVIQTVFWTVMFILTMVGARSGFTVIIGVLMFLSFLGLLIYASVIFHRHRKGTLQGVYSSANPNPQFQGFVQPAGHPAGAYPPSPYQHTDYQQTGYYAPTGYQSGGQPTDTTYSDPQYKQTAYYSPETVHQPPAGTYEMHDRTGHGA